ncbi:MAG: MerR family transcriptional regulator [Rhodoferax sp.]|jgi:DNA-binding transcriptional MerR regulator|nr:MerR family transcriptional regulator [Rhodoferax sp.]
MPTETDSSPPSYPLADLCVLADLPIRTVRYYVQAGLVDRPEGETRAARYCAKHLEQLLLIKKWTAAGVSLERIRELLQGAPAPVPPRQPAIGSVEVCSHLKVADGIELVIEPGRAGLSPGQVRHLIQGVMAVFAQVSGAQAADSAREHTATPSSTTTSATTLGCLNSMPCLPGKVFDWAVGFPLKAGHFSISMGYV